MNEQMELAEILKDAGCEREEIENIVSLYLQGDMKRIEKLIRKARREQLEKIHEYQQCIDRLDYFSYQFLNSYKQGIKKEEQNAL